MMLLFENKAPHTGRFLHWFYLKYFTPFSKIGWYFWA